ncbi:Zinc finger protein [Gossypium arboreum]|uniref:Zinc finger protein n=1 Tax=Gossypium arboreum TaxID=29729 RepID=A0A0B0PQK6_GOSAR|nr:Zinc finger protein [Gossypium arboreum]
MPLSQTRSYSHTYIGVTYQCQSIKCGLTRTHISESYVMTYVS